MNHFRKGLSVHDITPDFLRYFADSKRKAGLSRSTVDGIFRNLRRIISYFLYEKKTVPKSYDYPFGKGGFSISSSWPKKLVLRNDEIQRVIDYEDFESTVQEFARNPWLFLYRANGINFADLLRMRWDNIQGGYLIFFRKKQKLHGRTISSPLQRR